MCFAQELNVSGGEAEEKYVLFCCVLYWGGQEPAPQSEKKNNTLNSNFFYLKEREREICEGPQGDLVRGGREEKHRVVCVKLFTCASASKKDFRGMPVRSEYHRN